MYMVSIMSGMLHQVVGIHTDECDSLVPCETHLPHVPPTFSVQRGGSSLQHTSLVSQTTGENIQIVFTQ